MTIEGLAKWLDATPFKAFVMRLSNGREILVRHPELLARSPSGRTVVVYTSGDFFEMVDLLHVASIVHKNGRRHMSGGNGSTKGHRTR